MIETQQQHINLNIRGESFDKPITLFTIIMSQMSSSC
jgi:hypothetical protein